MHGVLRVNADITDAARINTTIKFSLRTQTRRHARRLPLSSTITEYPILRLPRPNKASGGHSYEEEEKEEREFTAESHSNT